MPKMNLRECFGKAFRVERRDGEYIITHRWPNELGDGYFFAYEIGRLGCFMAGTAKFNRLSAQFPSIEVMQRGDTEFVFAFDADLLPEVATALKAKRRRQLSEDAKARFRVRLEQAREKKAQRVLLG